MNLYIHIPFCASKCSYCHFYSICDATLLNDYVDAINKEISLRLPQSATIDTIYFGGGTPSILSVKQLDKIMSAIPHSKHTEITLEAHPNTLTKSTIANYYSMGINRLSIGIQSWHKLILIAMGRVYDQDILIKNIEFAQSLGLDNINIDHIISYPKQSDTILYRDLTQTLSLHPAHISIYPLERHPLTKIKHSPPTPKITRQFALAQMTLLKNGYRHYEELNFCLPHKQCLHNIAFWQGKDYLGVGASATSLINNHITNNISDVTDYIRQLSRNYLPQQQIITLLPTQRQALKADLNQRLLQRIST